MGPDPGIWIRNQKPWVWTLEFGSGTRNLRSGPWNLDPEPETLGPDPGIWIRNQKPWVQTLEFGSGTRNLGSGPWNLDPEPETLGPDLGIWIRNQNLFKIRTPMRISAA